MKPEELLEEIKNSELIIAKCREDLKSLKQTYIEQNKLASIGDKVRIENEKGEWVEGFVFRILFNPAEYSYKGTTINKMEYRFDKVKKNGERSKNTLQTWEVPKGELSISVIEKGGEG